MASQKSESLDSQPFRRTKLYEQVLESILRFVESSKLRPGDLLPTEREWAGMLSVSRASVRQAITVLEAEGIVDSRQGHGITLLAPDAPMQTLAKTLRRRRWLPDILEAREILEMQFARLAALRRDSDDVAEMEGALEFMQAEMEAGGVGLQGDKRFHHCVAKAAHNPVLEAVMSHLEQYIYQSREESLQQEGRSAVSLQAHREILDAIKGQDAERASEAMAAHLRVVGDVAVLRWEPNDAP